MLRWTTCTAMLSGMVLLIVAFAARADNELKGSKCDTSIKCDPFGANPCFAEKVDDEACPKPKKRCRLVKCDKGDFSFKFCKRTGSVDDECPPSGSNNINTKCTDCKWYNCGCAQGDGDCVFTACNCNDGGIDITGGWIPGPACT